MFKLPQSQYFLIVTETRLRTLSYKNIYQGQFEALKFLCYIFE